MARNPRRQDEELAELYAKLPTVACRGVCYDACGPIDLSAREKARMEQAAGHSLGLNGITCNMLVDGRCSVYAQRPFICHMWGVVESLPCIYGCKAEPGLMADSEASLLLAESLKVGGGLTHADNELFRLLVEAKAEDPENFKRMLDHVFKQTVSRPTLAGRGKRLPLIERTPDGDPTP